MIGCKGSTRKKLTIKDGTLETNFTWWVQRHENDLERYTHPIWETSPAPTLQKQVDPPDKMNMYLNMSKIQTVVIWALLNLLKYLYKNKIPETLSYPLKNSHQNNHLKCPLRSWQKIIVRDKTQN